MCSLLKCICRIPTTNVLFLTLWTWLQGWTERKKHQKLSWDENQGLSIIRCEGTSWGVHQTYNRLLSLARVASSWKSLGGSKLLPFKNAGGHCVLVDLQWCRNVLVPFPRSVPRLNPVVSPLYGQFLQPHGLVFALTCTVNCLTLYRQVCAFPIHVQSIEFTTGGLQSSLEMSQGW